MSKSNDLVLKKLETLCGDMINIKKEMAEISELIKGTNMLLHNVHDSQKLCNNKWDAITNATANIEIKKANDRSSSKKKKTANVTNIKNYIKEKYIVDDTTFDDIFSEEDKEKLFKDNEEKLKGGKKTDKKKKEANLLFEHFKTKKLIYDKIVGRFNKSIQESDKQHVKVLDEDITTEEKDNANEVKKSIKKNSKIN